MISLKFWRKRERIRTRTDLLNYLIRLKGYLRYLEIGVRTPRHNFKKIVIPEKDGVDPVGRCSYPMTSDEFFDKIAPQKPKYDIIFIDGLHLAEQTETDVANALVHLNIEGTIVLHDCNPPSEESQLEKYVKGRVWNGTVWKAWTKLRATRSDLFMCTVDIDWGCGVITRGSQQCYNLPRSAFVSSDANDKPQLSYQKLDYSYLEQHRRELLRLVSVSEFITLYRANAHSDAAAE